jgi:hypothetical protein
MRRRLGRLGMGVIGASVARIVVASAALALASYALWYVLDRELGRSFAAQLLAVSTALIGGTVVYVGACKALRVRELGALLALRRRLPQT